MNNEQVMHHFEGVLLPAWFYESPKEFLGVLAENSGALHEISSELFRRAQLESPFPPRISARSPETSTTR